MSLAIDRKHYRPGRIMKLASKVTALQVAAVLFVGWWQLLALFHTFPQIDIAAARAFFHPTVCPDGADPGQVCGTFIHAGEPRLMAARKVLFYLPWVAAVLILLTIWRNQRPTAVPARSGTAIYAWQAGCDALRQFVFGRRFADMSHKPSGAVDNPPAARRDEPTGMRKILSQLHPGIVAQRVRNARWPASDSESGKLWLMLVSLILGPYVLVNLLLKAFSGRPRPYQTDLFGGDMTFMPAGSFDGACTSNCSFISGEGAAAGWLFCLILLVPARNRVLRIPVIVAASLVTPALRVVFGGHYLSDVVLAWLSSLVVVALVFGVAELLRLLKKQGPESKT